MSLNAFIIGVGSYLPHKELTNHDLEKMVETSDEWIQKRTGIKKRHIAAPDEKTSDLAVKAAKKAIQHANIDLNEIDGIIVATTTPDLTFPATAAIVQKKLGIHKGFAFDVQAVCAGFIFALSTARAHIIAGDAKTILVIGAETLSRILDWSDRSTSILFGDGAGAVLLRATKENKGIIATSLSSDGAFCPLLYTSGGVGTSQTSGVIKMEGAEVFKNAVELFSTSIKSIFEKAHLSPDVCDLFVPHQANKRIIEAVAARLSFPMEKTIVTVTEHANTSAASIPLALDAAFSQNRISEGDTVLLSALGAGFSWGSMLVKF